MEDVVLYSSIIGNGLIREWKLYKTGSGKYNKPYKVYLFLVNINSLADLAMFKELDTLNLTWKLTFITYFLLFLSTFKGN